MKYILSISILILATSISYASDISCYSGDTIIYKGQANSFKYNDDFITFFDMKTKKRTYVEGNCIITLSKANKTNS